MIEKLREQFLTPQDEFTPIPFWFWNDELSKEELSRQIQDFYEKGVMGFVIHPRIGIPSHIEYLSDSFMELVRFAVEEAADRGMKVVLYDEAMYPSGSAHGMVVKDNPEYASCGLRMIEHSCRNQKTITPVLSTEENLVAALAVKKESDTTICPDHIVILDTKGESISFEPQDQGEWSILLFVEGFSKGTIRGIHFGEDDREENAPPSADLLNPLAMEKFIRLTHERYYSCLKEYFGDTIIAMFTDEPNILGRNHIRHMMPWTFGFIEWYIKEGNKVTDLPALWFQIGKETDEKRRNYKRAINKKLQQSYYGPIAKWCDTHHIALTGHPESSEDMELLKTFHIPGQDVVWRWVAPEEQKGIMGPHSTMAKCSSDIARHTGKRRNANECFGCCSPAGTQWGFTAADMKWYLDWLFVRGVNLIYPHAFYYSIDGEKRRNERPPDVGPNNIWWKYYRDISNYMKRMSWIMTDCMNVTDIAVLCEEDHLPWKIVKPLYENQIEFNYIDLSLFLSNECTVTEEGAKIQHQNYRVIIIEDKELLSPENDGKFQKLIGQGGTIIIYNADKNKLSLEGAIEINSYEEIVSALDKAIERDILLKPLCKDVRVSHTIKEGVHFYTLVNEGDQSIEGTLYIKTKGNAEVWDPWNGAIDSLPVEGEDKGYEIYSLTLDYRESKVLCINPNDGRIERTTKKEDLPNRQVERIVGNWHIYNDSQVFESQERLSSWTEWEGMEHYSGTIRYEIKWTVEEEKIGEKIFLELGEVYEIAQVYVNNENVGYKMWSPYIYDITKVLKPGQNQIIIVVTNSLTNQLDQNSKKSGLIGPVQLRYMNE